MPCSTNATFFFLRTPRTPRSTLFPYTTLFRSFPFARRARDRARSRPLPADRLQDHVARPRTVVERSEEHTSELQSLAYLVCRLLPEKTKSDCSTRRSCSASP